MTTRVQGGRTAVANTPPANNSLQPGELYVEMATPQRLWTGVPTAVAATGTKLLLDTAGPPAGAVIAATPPTVPVGTLWWDNTGGQLYIYYNDGNSSQWVPAANLAGVLNAAAATNAGRNLIHNGLFNISQRTGPFNAVTTGFTYALDRWRIVSLAAGDIYSVSRGAAVDADRAAVGDEQFSFYVSHNVTGGAGAGNACQFSQPIEGIRRLGGKTVTVSFWAAASGALKLGVSLDQSYGTGGSPSTGTQGTGQSVTLSGTWTRYALTFAVLSTAGNKTLGSNGDDCTVLNIWLSSGANNAARSGNVGVQTGFFNMWGVQLEVGSTATPLEKLDAQQTLSVCQRFYQTGAHYQWGYAGAAGNTVGGAYVFPVQMRGVPVITLTGTAGNANLGVVLFSPIVNLVTVNAPATVAGGFAFGTTFTASADL